TDQFLVDRIPEHAGFENYIPVAGKRGDRTGCNTDRSIARSSGTGSEANFCGERGRNCGVDLGTHADEERMSIECHVVQDVWADQSKQTGAGRHRWGGKTGVYALRWNQ